MEKKKDSRTIQWILRVGGSAFGWTGLLTGIRILQGITGVCYAYLLGNVVDAASAGSSGLFFQQLRWFLILVLTTLLLQASGRYVQEKSKAALDRAFRLHVFTQLLHRDYARVTQTHTGEWMNRITSDTRVVVTAAASIIPEITGALVRMLGALIALLQLTPQVTLLLLPCGLLMLVFSFFVRKRMKKFHKKAQQADGTVRSFMLERLSSLLVLRVFTQEERTAELATEGMDNFVAARMRRFRFVNLCSTLLGAFLQGAQALGIGLCGWGILRGAMTYGAMSSVLYLINLLETPFATISGHLSQFYSMLASAERLMEAETFPPDPAEKPFSPETARNYYSDQFAALEMNDVCFSYDESSSKNILQNFSLEIPKGAFVAFTGESGCGKSTALKLLLCLYPCRSGTLSLRGTDNRRQPLTAAWRALFAYVPQGNQLISGTVRETVTFSDPALMRQEEQIFHALEIACADRFVRDLPNGLDTVLGERGSGLSEGQMQRLSVARAILSGRPILLLDEATSALDSATETQLLQNLRSMTDRTVLIITHREAALDFCDQQVCMKIPSPQE